MITYVCLVKHCRDKSRSTRYRKFTYKMDFTHQHAIRALLLASKWLSLTQDFITLIGSAMQLDK